MDREPSTITLEQLYAFRDHLERLIARRGVQNPRSESERHLITHGHRLSHGCCAASGDAARATPPEVGSDVRRRPPGGPSGPFKV